MGATSCYRSVGWKIIFGGFIDCVVFVARFVEEVVIKEGISEEQLLELIRKSAERRRTVDSLFLLIFFCYFLETNETVIQSDIVRQNIPTFLTQRIPLNIYLCNNDANCLSS